MFAMTWAHGVYKMTYVGYSIVEGRRNSSALSAKRLVARGRVADSTCRISGCDFVFIRNRNLACLTGMSSATEDPAFRHSCPWRARRSAFPGKRFARIVRDENNGGSALPPQFLDQPLHAGPRSRDRER